LRYGLADAIRPDTRPPTPASVPALQAGNAFAWDRAL
jgi:hypothetical protein